jgi:ssDNA-binding Zn-finger/Zn-ribbon topoisomerase 1
MSEEPKEVEHCPKCGTVMQVLLFMGVQPDGWVCPECHLYFPAQHDGKPAEKPLAVVI